MVFARSEGRTFRNCELSAFTSESTSKKIIFKTAPSYEKESFHCEGVVSSSRGSSEICVFAMVL